MSLEELTHVEVYSASRHLQSTTEAPASVTLITAQEIHDHGYRTLADALNTVRGFFVTNDRNYSSLGVRGFARPGDLNTRILLLVDGHRLNDNVYEQAMIGTEFPIDVDLIERIEVVRGPVSSLYGSNALFGSINIITKRGRDLSGPEAAVSVGSYGTAQERLSYGKRIGQFDILASGTLLRSNGHDNLYYPEFDSPITNNGVASHLDGGHVESGFLNASFRDFTLHAVFGSREKDIPTASYGTVFDTPGTQTTDAHGYLDLRYEHTFGSWGLLARTYYDDYIYRGRYAYASDVNPAEQSPELDFGNGEWAGGEVQVTKTVAGNNRLIGGLEFRDNFRQDQLTYDQNPYTPQLDDRRSSFVIASYLQEEVKLTSKLDANAGLRYDFYSDTKGSVDPRVALVYRPAQGTALKLMYGEAFRAPNDYERFYAVAPNIANPTLTPERIRTTEGVWEQHLPDHLLLSTSLFYSRMTGLITQVETDSGALIYRNLQRIGSVGAEAELGGRLLRNSSWTASYSYQETSDEDSGQLLNNSPRSLGKLAFSQKVPKTSVTASLDAQYRARITTLAGSSVSPFTVVNATLLGRTFGRHADLSLSAYNLLNKNYADPASGSNTQAAIPQDGRSVRLQLTWHLDEQHH
ncbi:MAG: TonB-dependent receptor plug domain-containing protein [Janthinobacterium lividum]